MIDFSDILETVEEVEKEKPTEELIEMAILQLDSVCDGAITQDGVGFAGMHTRKGKWIAAKLLAGNKLNKFEIIWAKFSLPYYLNTQLGWLKQDFKMAIEDARLNEMHRFTERFRK